MVESAARVREEAAVGRRGQGWEGCVCAKAEAAGGARLALHLSKPLFPACQQALLWLCARVTLRVRPLPSVMHGTLAND